ncbi:MAG: FkbM family methyltransferase, partial [Acidimicrobiia bacterium]|nr:FkbM family methyltransferase [Acidimicrobiia bacterium]
DHDATETFHLNTGSSALSALRRPNQDHGPTEAITVPVRRLDDVIPDHLPIGYLKVDAIGAELLVLQGAERILGHDRPFVLFEASRETLDTFGLTAADLHGYVVGEAGYDLFSLRGWLAGEPPLTVERLERAMIFPFEAFNFAAVPRP